MRYSVFILCYIHFKLLVKFFINISTERYILARYPQNPTYVQREYFFIALDRRKMTGKYLI